MSSINLYLIFLFFTAIPATLSVKPSLHKQQKQKPQLDVTTSTATSAMDNASAATEVMKDSCEDIERVFRNVSDSDEAPACRCLPEALGTLHDGSGGGTRKESNVWIGCTRHNMPSIFRSLCALPSDTTISRIWIWNSLISSLPNDMFAKVRPKVLVIENSAVSVFRKGVFSSIGKHLKILSLKNNIVKNIERKTFSDLDSLESLDLSGNKLSELKKGQFDDLRLLENFQLIGNKIASIEDGTFESLNNLKILNLQDNKLVNITKDTFRGLKNLETLNLNGNNISHIDRDAFTHMKKLQTVNLGSNKISEVEFRALGDLERLYLNNNSIAALDHVTLQDLPSLKVLSLDRNAITRVTDTDFLLLTRGKTDIAAANNSDNVGNGGVQLKTLSLAANNISEIGCHAFENLPMLDVLSLQNNKISTLLCTDSALVQSVLRPLQNLRRLFLSGNVIQMLDNGDINVLPKLKELALDHNQIHKITQNTFKGLNLTKLFLNKNRLYYLPEGLFDSWDKKNIKAVDLSDNPRECICDREWVDSWLRDLGLANTGSFGCLPKCDKPHGQTDNSNGDENVEDEFEGHSFWITVIAGVLAVVALIFLVAASYIYMQANCYPLLPGTVGVRAGLSLRNLPPDMIRLIPSQESLLSFPNPIAGPNGPELLLKPAPPPQPISTISINIGHDCQKKMNGGIREENPPVGQLIHTLLPNAAKHDKKRVRFDGI